MITKKIKIIKVEKFNQIYELYKKKGGDFSLPPSPHRIFLIDSLQLFDHLIVEN